MSQGRRRLRAGVLSAVLGWGAAFGAVPAAPASAVTVAPAPPTGPDVASYQHPYGACISWATVASGTGGSSPTPARQFAFVKATDGASYTNPYFSSCGGGAGDWSGTRAAGLVRGAYHFARPGLPFTTATDQAQHYAAVVRTLSEQNDLPPVLDLELTDGLSPGQLVTWTQLYVDAVRKSLGRAPIIYTYPYFWATAMAGSNAFAAYPLWIASYNGGSAPAMPSGWSSWKTWQYSDAVAQPGISSGPVDMSRFNGDLAALRSFADGTRVQPWTRSAPSSPVHVHASPHNGSATVQWVPGANGGALVSSYVVSASNGTHVTVGGTTTSMTYAGLRDGSAVSFTVRAVNAIGTSPASATSNTVTPLVPTAITSSLSRALVSYGQSTSMSARLIRTDTQQPLAGRTLSVFRRAHGTTTFSHVADVTTNSTGTATWAFVPSGATDVMMRWAAPVGWQASQTYTRTVLVRPIVRAALSATSVRLGHSVTLSGQVVPGLGGRVVYRQGYYSGSWHTWATTVLSSTSRYTFVITPTVRTTDIYRVYLPASTRLTAAASATLSLTVT